MPVLANTYTGLAMLGTISHVLHILIYLILMEPFEVSIIPIL